MGQRIDRLRAYLRLDGVDYHPFILIGFALVWGWPELGYEKVRQRYAEYIGDAPERVQAELCRRLLAAGKEIAPEEYFRILKGRIMSEN